MSTYVGEVIGVDEVIDLAVIKLKANRTFKAIPFGNPDAIGVGDDVIAIGFPLGSNLLGPPTVTKGIVSSRRLFEDGVEFLQTDAAINPGNSGGPLVNLDGTVVGINTLKAYAEGIGLAIAINDVRRQIQFLKDGGVVRLPWQTYQDETYGFAVDIAPGWEITDSGETTVIVPANDELAFLRITVLDLSGTNLGNVPLDALADWRLGVLEQQAISEGDKYELISKDKMRDGASEFYWIAYTWEASGFCSEFRIDVLRLSPSYPSVRRAFLVMSTICQHSEDTYFRDRLDMLDSLRFQ